MAAAAGRGFLTLAGHSLGPGAVRSLATASKAAQREATKAVAVGSKGATIGDVVGNSMIEIDKLNPNNARKLLQAPPLQVRAYKKLSSDPVVVGSYYKGLANRLTKESKVGSVLTPEDFKNRQYELKQGRPTTVYGNSGLPTILGINAINLMTLMQSRFDLAGHLRHSFLTEVIETHYRMFVPRGCDVDHPVALWNYQNGLRFALQPYFNSTITPIIEHLIYGVAIYANFPRNLVVMTDLLNIALDKARTGQVIHEINGRPIDGGARRLSEEQVIEIVYRYPYGYRIYKPNPETGMFEPIPNAVDAYRYLREIEDRAYNDFLVQMLLLVPQLDNEEGRRLLQAVYAELQRGRAREIQAGGAFNVSSITDSLRKQLIEQISQLINNYLGNTEFTYSSFFNLTYAGEISTKEQRLEDAKFTFFLFKLIDKLEKNQLEAAAPDLEILYNKFPIYKSEPFTTGIKIRNKAVANSRAKAPVHITSTLKGIVEPRETPFSEQLKGGTRKLKRFKKTRKALRPRKRKTRRHF